MPESDHQEQEACITGMRCHYVGKRPEKIQKKSSQLLCPAALIIINIV